MNELTHKRRITSFKYIPIVGIITFVLLYIFSSTLYPGGSQLDINSKGFDWLNNYWCNLMNENGMNGELNPARPYSILAMIVLCLSLLIFFIQFANSFPKSNFWKIIIQFGGTLSMLSAIFIFTDYHDLMTIISSLFGVFVVVGIIREVYQSDMTKFKISGMLCLALLAMNNYIYYSEQFISVLPLLQKVTFAVVLIWIIGLNLEMIKKKGT